MNSDTTSINRASGAATGFIIASLIFIALVAVVKFSVLVPAIDADRAAAISKALFEINTNEVALLNNAGWIDQSRGIVRLPIEKAMQATLQAWQNPAASPRRPDLASAKSQCACARRTGQTQRL